MFFVYGTAGQVYKGSGDRVAQVAGVQATSRTARVRAVSFADVERGATTPALALAHAPLAGPAHDAVLAYAQAGQAAPPARQPLTRVEQIMSTGVVSVAHEATALQGWRLLARHHIAQAPVVNAQGALVGLLRRADLLPPELLAPPDAEPAAWPALAALPVHELMVTPVPAVALDAEIRHLAQALLDTGLPGLPVTDDAGQVMGFVSRSDILRALATEPPLDLWS